MIVGMERVCISADLVVKRETMILFALGDACLKSLEGVDLQTTTVFAGLIEYW
jgi:hypothetical protein